MTAVAPDPPQGNADDGNRPNVNTAQSPSRFTAVNGREQSGPLLNGTPDANGIRERSQSLEGRPRSVPLITPDQHDNPLPEAVTAPSGASSGNRLISSHNSTNDNPNKRKRTGSPERTMSPSATLYGTQSASNGPVQRSGESMMPQQPVADTNGSTRPPAAPESDTSMQPPPSERVEATRPDSNSPTRNQHNSQPPTHGHQLPQNVDSPDVRLAEAALKRGGQSPSTARSQSWEPANKPTNEPNGTQTTQVTNNTQEQAQTVPVPTPQRRRRVFSNRTKTGCKTCRRRKKKCDENRPECNNCRRGDFVCEGYGPQGPWQRPSNSNGPVPLEPRDRYQEVAHHYIQDPTHQRPDTGAPTAVHANGTKSRILSGDDADRNMPYITSPGAGSRSSWPNGSWPPPGPPSFAPDHAHHTEFRDGFPMAASSRPERARTDYPVVHNGRGLAQPPHRSQGMGVFQSNVEHRPGRPTPAEVTNYPAQAQQALNSIPRNSEKTAKEKMLDGEEYFPSDPELLADRERCQTALAQFERAQNPLHSISADEKTRLLKRVLGISPDSQPEVPFTKRLGDLKPGAVVEKGFKCNYGYIDIGEDVQISENCTVIDDCTVRIGAHTWIGPGVQILSSMATSHQQGRRGSKSPYKGGRVDIGLDCWIGPGCTILPGVTINRGACIAPGETVKSNVGEYSRQGVMFNYP